MVDIRQMRYFVTLAEMLHFRRAAERLNVTQPPLSRQVAALEQELGVQLLERSTRQVRLTTAGERLLTDGKSVLNAFDQACRNAQLAHAGNLGELSIGFMMNAAYSSLPGLARNFMTQCPQVKLKLREIVPTAILPGLLGGELDAAITFSLPPIKNIASATILQEPLMLVVHHAHRLANKPIVSAEDLRGEALIVAPETIAPTLRHSIAEFLASAALEPDIRLETELQQTIVSLVAEDLGLALVPASLRKIKMNGVVFRDVLNAPQVEHVLAWHSSNINPALARFLRIAGIAER